jgi:tRNA(fMet)-specific endonuclease VapC
VSRVLLDTSAYSAAERGNEPLVDVVRRASEVVLTPVVLGELRAGFLSGGQRNQNEKKLAQFLELPRVTVVPMGEETSHCYAVIKTALKKAGSPIPINDVWIAASAMQYGLTVVTTDKDFERVPQIITWCFDPKG